MKEILKKYSWIRLAASIVGLAIGVITIILSVVLINQGGEDPSAPIRILVAISLMCLGLGVCLLGLWSNDDSSIIAVGSGALVFGLGLCFVLQNIGPVIVNIVVIYAFPLLMAIAGGAIVLKALISLFRKGNNVTANLSFIISGGILLALGTCFYCINELHKWSWFFIGIAFSIAALAELIQAIRLMNQAHKIKE